MKSLTIVYITARKEPHFEWFFDSLVRQKKQDDNIELVVIDLFAYGLDSPSYPPGIVVRHVAPKPTVWQGPHRLTKTDWWAASSARNTGICLCQTEWIAFLDDRCVLLDGWLQAIRDAMAGNYAVCGAYEKRHSMTVENGIIRHGGIITGEDTRENYMKQYRPNDHIMDAPGEWFFGCTTALPLEWALAVNGYDETCDGLSMEDVIFGLHLQNSEYPIKYDRRMKIIEDRTSDQLGTPMKREDKGVSPNDKSHKLLEMLRGLKRASHPIDLRQIRADVLAGKPFPPPWGPLTDFYDGQPISEMT